MISLRSFVRVALAAAASLAVASCADGPSQPLSKGVQPSSASFDGKVGDVGNAAKNGDIDVRVALAKDGSAFLTIRTGTYNPATNVAIPNGYFQSIQYKIYNAAGKQVQVKNVKFKTDGISVYTTAIDLCSSGDDDDDDDDHSSSASSCSLKYGLNWSVSVQANLKGVGGDPRKTDVVREDGVDGYLPDIDIATQPLWIVGANGSTTPAGSSVPAAAPIVYSVAVPNNKPINGVPNTYGVMTTCLVSVDGKLQFAVPNVQLFGVYTNPFLLSYPNGATGPIPAGTVGSCQFSLSLPAGAHTITVKEVVVWPGDYDLSNNSVTFNVTAASGPPDVKAVGGLQKLVSGTYSDLGALTLASGQSTITTTVYQKVSQVALTVPGAVTCKFTVDGTDVGTSGPAAPALNGVASFGYCSLPVTLTVGTHTVAVTAITAGETNLGDNTATTSVTVAAGPISGTLSSSLFLTTAGKVPLGSASVLSGSTNSYSAEVALANLVNTAGPLPVSCTVQVDNMVLVPGTAASIGTSTVLLTWVTPSGQNFVANNATVPCNFTLNMTERGNADVAHTVKVTATTNATATPTSTISSGTVTNQVRVDLAGVALKAVSGSSMVDLTAVPMGATATVGMIFHNPDPTHRVTFNCTVTGAGTVGTSYTPISISNVIAEPNSDGVCTWSLKPTNLQSLEFIVTATPVTGAPVDPNTANNTISGVVPVKSNGKFTSFDANGTFVLQEWYNTVGSTGFPIQKLTQQAVQVTKLALLVIPTNDGHLGQFKVTGQVTAGSTVFPAGFTSGSLIASGNGVACSVSSGPQSFPNPPVGLPSQYGFYASICSEPTTLNGVGGFQQITVNYVQTVNADEERNPIVNPGSWSIQEGNVDVFIQLDFTLPGGLPDMVKGTIRIPSGQQYNTNTGSDLNPGGYVNMTRWQFVNFFGTPATILP